MRGIRFTPSASGYIDSQQADSPRLHFVVTDTGIGILTDRLQVIFGAFSQSDASSTRNFGGSGLGLAISTRLVNLMGGRNWVESEFNHGSAFHFVVPVEFRDQGSALSLTSTQSLRKANSNTRGQRPTRSYRVFIIDTRFTSELDCSRIWSTVFRILKHNA